MSELEWGAALTMSEGTVIEENVYRPMDSANRTIGDALHGLGNACEIGEFR